MLELEIADEGDIFERVTKGIKGKQNYVLCKNVAEKNYSMKDHIESIMDCVNESMNDLGQHIYQIPPLNDDDDDDLLDGDDNGNYDVIMGGESAHLKRKHNEQGNFR
eukprot:3822182-Ditylum_brightwellii.AAC.1